MIPAALRRRRYSLLWLLAILALALALATLAAIPVLRAPNDGTIGGSRRARVVDRRRERPPGVGELLGHQL
jgi:hypothetical protein